MQLCDINPYMRYAGLQPSVLSSIPFSRAYDYRIFYILEDRAKFIYDGKTFDIEAGTLLYFRPDVPYYFDGKIKVIVLNFDLTRRHTNIKTLPPPLNSQKTFDSSLVVENDPPPELSELIVIKMAFDAESVMQKCLAHYCVPTPFSDALTSALIKELLCYMAENSASETDRDSDLIQRMTAYIRQNYDRDISNSDISSEFGYHPFYLNRIFKKSTGMTIHQAVLTEKMILAKQLLRETTLTVSSVACEVGFPDRSQFCTAFKKHTGYTPTEYRKKRAFM